MATIVFKRLFEVQILHEYFLLNDKGVSIFSLSDIEQDQLLFEKFKHRQYNVKQQFGIEPTKDTEKKLRGLKLKFAMTDLGFIVGIEVVVSTENGVTNYMPRIKWQEGEKLYFNLKSVNEYFGSITNTRLKTNAPAKHFFSNKNKSKYNNSLIITNSVASIKTNRIYEMGELALINGIVQTPNENTDGTDLSKWSSITDFKYANEADKILLPQKFTYKFPYENAIKQAKFTLKKEDGSVIKIIDKEETQGFKQVKLNFKTINQDAAELIPSGKYQLEINTDTGISDSEEVILDDNLYRKENLGIIEIHLDGLNPEYSLLDDEGQLKTKVINGNKIPNPKYEIRFQSRPTFWRYIKTTGFNSTEINNTNTFLNQESNTVLVSKVPKKASSTLIPFENGGATILAMPKIGALNFSADKFYSDIYISKANRII